MNILITGASSGFGTLITQQLIKDGHTLIASMRDPNGRNQSIADQLKSEGAMVVDIDVTDQANVESGVADAIAQAGKIDVLINNAGVGVHGIQEMFTVEDMQSLFDINVFGVQRMIREVLPHFHNQHSGLIVNISSILGRMTIPFYGPYNASKWALEGLTENYRTELSAFGIDVALVEPGGFPTAFMDRLIRPSDQSRNAFYGDMVDAPKQAQEGFEEALASNPAQAPQIVADAVSQLIATPAGERQFRTVVDKMGMGDHIEGYNDHLAKVTEGVYSAFGTDGMLKLNVNAGS